MTNIKTLTELGTIMLEVAGAEACERAYGTTEPRFVGQAALHWADIEIDGTLT